MVYHLSIAPLIRQVIACVDDFAADFDVVGCHIFFCDVEWLVELVIANESEAAAYEPLSAFDEVAIINANDVDLAVHWHRVVTIDNDNGALWDCRCHRVAFGKQCC